MNALYAKHITTGGSIRIVTPADGKHFSLAELQTFVGGYIEILNPESQQEAVMVINEEGKLKGLPPNPLATQIWNSRALPGDYIVGDVLLCHRDQLE
jgi:uncharacterized protein DUF3846